MVLDATKVSSVQLGINSQTMPATFFVMLMIRRIGKTYDPGWKPAVFQASDFGWSFNSRVRLGPSSATHRRRYRLQSRRLTGCK